MKRINFRPEVRNFWEKAEFDPETGKRIEKKIWSEREKIHAIVDGEEERAIYQILLLETEGEKREITPLTYSDFNAVHFPYCYLCGGDPDLCWPEEEIENPWCVECKNIKVRRQK